MLRDAAVQCALRAVLLAWHTRTASACCCVRSPTTMNPSLGPTDLTVYRLYVDRGPSVYMYTPQNRAHGARNLKEVATTQHL